MKVILIDDENLALNYLEYQLLNISDVEIEIVGKFVDPLAGMEKILHEDVEVVFLDIQLPGINGIELAERILESKPELTVAFVTAHDDYAIKAFELNAIDYVLKPVGLGRLSKTVQRIQETLRETLVTAPMISQTIRMKTFHQLSIESEYQHLAPMRWRTTKAQELFLYLFQHRGQFVRKSTLIELLWPEYEASKVYSQLYTAVYHTRKTLEPFRTHIKISNVADGYILNIENVLLDVEEWESKLHFGPPITLETIDDYERIMDLYSGDYLQDFEYWWAESERHRLKLLWLQTSLNMAECYASCNLQEKSIKKYLEICNHHPQAEEAHFALMKIYAAMNNHLSVHLQYRLLTTVLMDELNEQPSPYITEWYRQWNQTE
jgi:Response regulator containing CheY-like receiver and SARP domains